MPDRREGRRAAPRYVYPFDAGVESSDVLGGKGASLARMRALGLLTPPGFTVATDGWRAFVQAGHAMPEQIRSEIESCTRKLEQILERRFGDPTEPLLVSVRSGAPISMPGMMDTILNLGMNRETAARLAESVDADFAWGLYRRLLGQFGTVVRGIDPKTLAAAEEGAAPEAACDALLGAIEDESGSFPQSPEGQLIEAVEAVWRSWDGRRARRYRRYSGVPDDLGTAVTVQGMVFGTLDERSGTGVVFTRDPATGSPGAYGDFLGRAQGEDVVAGSHQTEPLDTLRRVAPEAFEELERALPTLEAAYRDMCDVEFTVERGKLWILQARAGQRSGAAAVRIAVDLVDEGLIDPEEALRRIPISALRQLQAPVLAREQDLDLIGEGTPAAPGAASGGAVFDAERAQQLAEDGESVILVRPETSPEDISGMIAASGIVTAVGGRTSHAAVVARGIGRPAICGVAGLHVDPESGRARFGERQVVDGERLTIDGAAGIVAVGEARLVPAQPEPRAAQLLSWCDERRAVDIREQVPPDYRIVEDPDQIEGDRIIVDLAWNGPSTQGALERIVSTAAERGVERLALRLPDGLTDGDLMPPPAPWTVLVAPDDSWPARLLATRMHSVGDGH